jgi:hypothetical protein
LGLWRSPLAEHRKRAGVEPSVFAVLQMPTFALTTESCSDKKFGRLLVLQFVFRMLLGGRCSGSGILKTHGKEN